MLNFHSYFDSNLFKFRMNLCLYGRKHTKKFTFLGEILIKCYFKEIFHFSKTSSKK